MEIHRPCLLLLATIVLAAIDYGSACWKRHRHRPTWHRGPGYRATWILRERRSADANPDAQVLLRLCDVDQSSYISFTELRKCMFLPSRTAQAKLQQMDVDGNGVLTLNEIQHVRFDTSDSDTCYHATLKKCGLRFLVYTRTRDTDETSMCGAFQEYVDCLAEDTICDLQIMTSFKHALIDMVASGKNDSICPNVDISVLGQASVGKYSALACSKLAIVDCDIMFLSDLHDSIDPCESLAVYEQCIKESTNNCDDDPARYARAGSHALVVAYLEDQTCN